MIERLQTDPEALRQVKEEMESLQKAGFIAKLEDMSEEIQKRLNEDIKILSRLPSLIRKRRHQQNVEYAGTAAEAPESPTP